MNAKTFAAFSDELTKIAFYQKVSGAFMNLLREGWHGTKEAPNTWMGQGRVIKPGMSPMARTMEEATSLGGLTKALPVGAKSLTALGTALAAHQAMQHFDPSGQNRSPAERMSRLGGNVVGGLVGSALASRHLPGSMLGNIGGSLIGGYVGEKVMNAPFAAARAIHGRPRPVVGYSDAPAQPTDPNYGVSQA
jgi:hypothetical protein